MQFTKLRFKNFLSFGNKFTELKLDTNHATLITGENGAGKTASLEAFYFVMTGKPFRKIKKDELINTTNKKELLVELEFTHEKHNYLIKRGIKPNIFEIYRDNNLVEQDAATKDYQQILENILGLDSKTLGQSIFISSKNYTPFLKLAASDKRSFIENVLDIKIFSQILEQLKIKRSVHKETHQSLEYELESARGNLKLAQESNEKFSTNKKEQITSLEKSINDEKTQIKNGEASIEKILNWRKKTDIENIISNLEDNINTHHKNLDSTIKQINSEMKDEFDKLYSSKTTLSKELDELKEKENALGGEKANLINEQDKQITEIKHDTDRKKQVLQDAFKSHKKENELKQAEITNKISKNTEKILFFENNSVCPTCEQEISTKNDAIHLIITEIKALNQQYQDDIKASEKDIIEREKKLEKIINKTQKECDVEVEKISKKYQKLIDDTMKQIEDLILERNKFIKQIDGVDTKIKQHSEKVSNKTSVEKEKTSKIISDLTEKKSKQEQNFKTSEVKINEHNSSINSSKRLIQSYESQIAELQNDKKELVDIKPIQKKVTEYQKNIESSEYKKETIDMMIKMLGDKGLKSYIIKKYIPTLNELVNKHLEMFGATYRLSFDENFDINIHARGYEKLQYGSFSSGEEQRVDIALLFSFIELGKLKNSINCNTLFLDEIADVSLDSFGLDGLFMMFENMKKQNQTIFTISHRPELKDRFDEAFEVRKVNNFSQLNEV